MKVIVVTDGLIRIESENDAEIYLIDKFANNGAYIASSGHKVINGRVAVSHMVLKQLEEGE